MKPTEITSPTNAQFKIFKSLLTSKGIKDERQFILSGEKLITEFLKERPAGFEPQFLLFSDEVRVQTECRLTRLSTDLFKELDVLGTNFNLLVVSYSEISEKDFSIPAKGLEIISPLGDPRNLGALIRTAAAFGAQELILTSESTHPYLPHSLKASAGAALKISMKRTKLKMHEIPLVEKNYALEMHGKNLLEVDWPEDLRLWVGEEGPGLKLSHEQKKCMSFIHIATENVESLNATVSTSLAIWQWKNSQ